RRPRQGRQIGTPAGDESAAPPGLKTRAGRPCPARASPRLAPWTTVYRRSAAETPRQDVCKSQAGSPCHVEPPKLPRTRGFPVSSSWLAIAAGVLHVSVATFGERR